MANDNTYRPAEIARDFGEIILPEGMEHGTYRAAMRTGCACERCVGKRAKLRKRHKTWRR